MDINKWMLYIFIINLSLYCPGPMTIYLLNKGISYEYRIVMFSILGASTAYLGQMLFVIFGFDLINNTWPFIFYVIKLIGALYFVYLGIKQFSDKTSLLVDSGISTRRTILQLYKQGFLIGISNPKAIFLFIALFSEFIELNSTYNFRYQQSILICTFLFFQFISASVYAVLGSALYQKILKKGYVKIQKVVTGSIFLILGVVLAVAKIS
jgi:threonine/homoserine/homoserine lactone efflux protein